jgi:Protein of unknown function (DUF3618)
MNVREAEAEVERQRALLETTLGQLRENLRPRRLVREVASGGHWLGHYSAFARNSKTSWAVMGVAAALAGWDVARRLR